MGETTLLHLPFPEPDDPANVPADIEALAEAVETSLGLSTTVGLLGARPAAGVPGRRYYATDVVAEYLDTGSTWIRTSMPPGIITSTLLTAAPTGWIQCTGGAVSNSGITAELYAALAPGPYATPDLAGRSVIGVGTATGNTVAPFGTPTGNTAKARAEKGGQEKYALASGEIATHTHSDGTLSAAGHQHIHMDPIAVNSGNLIVTDPRDGQRDWSGSSVDQYDVGPSIAGVNIGNGSMNIERYGVLSSPSGADVNGSTGNKNGNGDGTAGSVHQNMPPYCVLLWIVKL
jgi:microcystin-dependent protein